MPRLLWERRRCRRRTPVILCLTEQMRGRDARRGKARRSSIRADTSASPRPRWRVTTSSRLSERHPLFRRQADIENCRALDFLLISRTICRRGRRLFHIIEGSGKVHRHNCNGCAVKRPVSDNSWEPNNSPPHVCPNGATSLGVTMRLSRRRYRAPPINPKFTHPHNTRDAIRAPSARLLNFAQTISGSISGR